MMEQALDFYSFYHVIGGFALGVFLGAFVNRKYALQLALILPMIWEVIENNVFASWLHLIEQEAVSYTHLTLPTN